MSQRQLGWQLEAYPYTIPAIEAFFEFPYNSLENGHKRAKSGTTLLKMANFHPKKSYISKTRLKLQNRLDGGNFIGISY